MKTDLQPGDVVRFTEAGKHRFGKVQKIGYKAISVEVNTPWTLVNGKTAFKKFKPEQLKKEGG